MPSDDDQMEPTRLTRRTTLKGLGLAAGGAVAWTAPTILSTSAASAATVNHSCTTCGPDPCIDQTDCGTDSGTGLACFCTPEVGTGTCICTQDVPCAGLTACPGGTCPPGFACQVGCCGTPLCFPLCA